MELALELHSGHSVILSLPCIGPEIILKTSASEDVAMDPLHGMAAVIAFTK